MTETSPVPEPGASDRLARALRVGAAPHRMATTHLALLLTPEGTVADCSESVFELLGRTRAEMREISIAELLPPGELGIVAKILAHDARYGHAAGASVADAEIDGVYRLKHADGTYIWFEMVRVNLIADPEVRGVLTVGRPCFGHRPVLENTLWVIAYDIEGSEAIQSLLEYLKLELPEARCALLIAGEQPDWIYADPELEALSAGAGPWDLALAGSARLTAVVGDPDAMSGPLAAAAAARGFTACWCLPLPLLEPEIFESPVLPSVARANVRRSPGGSSLQERIGCLVVWTTGAPYPAAPTVSTLEKIAGLVEIALLRRSDSDRLRRLASYDQVTGALSRVGMGDQMVADGVPRAQILVDLDGFKSVNDTHGHAVGDDVLRLAVRRISAVLRFQDKVVRLGGDEFLVLLPDLDEAAAVLVASRIVAAFAEPFVVGTVSANVGASIGIALADRDAAITPEILTARADAAMYFSKRTGKNRWTVWRPDLSGAG